MTVCECEGMHVRGLACGDRKLTLDIFLIHSPFHLLTEALTSSAGLLLALGIPSLCLPGAGLTENCRAPGLMCMLVQSSSSL